MRLTATCMNINGSSLFILTLLAIMGITANGCGSTPGAKMQRPAPLVEIETLKTASLIHTLPLTGDLVAVESARISSMVDGVIAFCGFREGDMVQEGTTLIEIDREALRAEVSAIEAALEVARARLTDMSAGTRPEEIDKAFEDVKQFKESTDFAKKDLDRISMLVQSGALPKEELEKARVKFVSDQARYNSAKRQLEMLKNGVTVTAIGVQRALVKEAEARLELARARLAECIVKAPFNGVVTRLLVQKGDMAAAKTQLLELSNFASIVIRCSVPEKFATRVTEGMTAEVFVDAFPNRPLKAAVSRIFPDLDSRMRTRTIELKVEDTVELMPGMFARLKLVLEELPDSLSLPVQAVRKKPDGNSFVFVFQEGKALATTVKTGQMIADRIQITEGIAVGDKVIVAGNEKLKDGSEVRIPGGAKK